MIRQDLFSFQDKKYKEFSAALVPNIDLDKVIGVRVPVLRRYAKQIKDGNETAEFLNSLPHDFLEENALHSFLLEGIRDYDSCIKAVNEFLPYVDNWATCDGMNPRCFKSNTKRLLEEIKTWIASPHTYTCRFGILNLMRYFLEKETFKPEYLQWVARIRSGEYYVKMMQAWFVATALAKQYPDALSVLQNRSLDTWTHNKAVQKARESLRISPERKAELLVLKVK